MWSAISKLFSKANSESKNCHPTADACIMDRNEDRRKIAVQDLEPQDTYDTRQAKQRASVKWLLSKAYNNRVPENLREPFYRDQEDQEHLKPQIVHSLANAELYCLGLANIYSDPNYHNLNHWGIIQALARKGVLITEPPDDQLTETVLIQTNPIKLSAHMAVIEAIMVLYAKEVVTPDRVVAAIQRFSFSRAASPDPLPADHEGGLVLWVNKACSALKQRIEQEMEQGDCRGREGDRLHVPDLPPVQELKDLCDGISLAALVSFYCPEELPWTDVVVSYLPTVSDCVQNLMLVYNFCTRSLPCSVFHMMPEDVTYMRGSMKQNLVVFLADLFNVLEIHPVKCVRFPGTDKNLKEVYPRNSQGVAHKRSFPQSISAIPDLRSNLGAHSSGFTVSKSSPTIQTSLPIKKSHSLQHADTYGKSTTESHDRSHTQEERHSSSEDQFVVHRGRGVPTLSSVVQAEEPLLPARLRPAKEKQNQDSKAEERGEPVAAGRPSNWEDSRRSSYAGRRSRRNSVSDDSQLTLENFGGSQENLHLLGRNPDKEPAVHTGKKNVCESTSTALRTSAQEARSIGVELLFHDNNGYSSSEKRDEEKSERSNMVSLKQVTQHSKEVSELCDMVDGDVGGIKLATSFAELSRHKAGVETPKGIHIVYMQHDREQDVGSVPPKSSFLNKRISGNNSNGSGEKKTTFAALPSNTTTWQQQSSSTSQLQQTEMTSALDDTNANNHIMASQLHNIRMKLEEKRRLIESEKRRMEVVMSKQRQKVGKAAFLQAVTKGKNTYIKTPESDSGKDSNGDVVENMKPQRPFSLQEISEDVTSVEHKWLDGAVPFTEERKTPDIENMDLEQYQQSIAQMNSSLHEIQNDIQRLATQQNQIQDLSTHHHLQGLVNQQQHQIQDLSGQQLQSLAAQQQMQSLAFQQNMQGFDGQTQFYLHDQQQQAQRRTWAQQAPSPTRYPTHQAQQDVRMLWGDPQSARQQMLMQNSQPASYNCQPQGGFVLHEGKPGSFSAPGHPAGRDARYHNGEHPGLHHSLGVNNLLYSSSGNGGMPQHTSFQLHSDAGAGVYGSRSAGPTPPSASPQHRSSTVHRISQLMGESPEVKRGVPRNSLEQQQSQSEMTPEKSRSPGVIHAPIPTPPMDDMEPQSISFIGAPVVDDHTHNLAQGIKGLQITSGSRTYRIPSPTRPSLSRNSFQQQESDDAASMPSANEVDPSVDGGTEKGFYISFDSDVAPKRPKPPLRVRKSSPKKERPVSQFENQPTEYEESRLAGQYRVEPSAPREAETVEQRNNEVETSAAPGVGLVIGSELLNPDPNALDEMERKKERIMLLSLQRRQQQEEMKQHKEQEAQHRRELEKLKQDERERKKEEERLRRAAILEQYKLKKAIEEAEREGKLLPEKADLATNKPVPKMRNKTSAGSRPRPKTIHVDSGGVGSGVDMQEGILSPSRSKKGSTSNLTDTVFSPHMRRDFYRGSQDSLADRIEERRGVGTSLFRDSPDDGRGASPCRSVNQLGRRGSYKTSRGSSTDQDSMVYRYTDTDSGLGRATPPRRAPSPGMSSMRHLPSPSGPGSLPPGLMTKRRVFDDGSSDISSTPSSMMEYTGPRLYKQPTTKSNRGIMLNAVEYCVFPGVVNKEAKRRVLEEIARSESKHFLILFRDAGCQFRALYSYCPEQEEVCKLYGTGPKQVNDRMFDKFFKYNSGGKCFSQVHTKHLTVTIDAFTIHNSLWQGKKVALPNKKDMALVI
ncbi:patronin isoform X2 [Zootermopsis nevadensis]|uniref:patronin isoform X2 n=1 Tax=Zootermopsis nevadensis TaxID=136037 RepID=UPI000B8EBFA6|nr:patronin isoform X2 [Zootermopsis nevadensis]